jgi:hypothetical protein
LKIRAILFTEQKFFVPAYLPASAFVASHSSGAVILFGKLLNKYESPKQYD